MLISVFTDFTEACDRIFLPSIFFSNCTIKIYFNFVASHFHLDLSLHSRVILNISKNKKILYYYFAFECL